MDGRSLISAVDLLPTFCDIAGAPLPADSPPDGVSQLATLKGEPAPLRDKPLFWKMGASKSRPDHWVAYAIVHEKWKLVTDKDASRVELYDISADLAESSDLRASEPEKAAALLEKLETWKATLPAKPTGEVFSSLRKG